MNRTTSVVVLMWLASFGVFAQFRPVDPRLTHHRVVAIVPVTGEGTKASPFRPMLTDLPGVIAWTAEVSDNKRFCLVELVARTPGALTAAFTNPGWLQAAQSRNGLPPGIEMKMQRKEESSAKEVYAEFAKLKRNFRPETFGVAVP